MERLKRLRLPPLYILSTLLLGLKIYIIYRFMFDIKLDNIIQEIILFMNPFVSTFLILSLSVWIKKESRQMKFIRYTTLIGTLIIYFNLLFYRSFTDFLTIPQLFQTSNAGQLGSSILSLLNLYDVLFLVDVAIIWYLSKTKSQEMSVHYARSTKVFAIIISFVLLAGNFLLAEIERPQLFTRTFDREYLVKNIGLFNYHIYDVIQQSLTKTQRVFADGNELPDIESYINDNVRDSGEYELFGAAKDRNVIFISAESVQQTVINRDVKGKEITPFLNQLVDDDDTFYFENFYHQTQQGKTSDSEFLLENSLYPLSRGAVFFTHAQNKYHALPEVLGDHDYYSAVFHANNRSFWNRDQMYDRFKYDYFYDEDAYEISDANSVGWGLKDKPYFEQSIKYLQALDQPFYTKFLTLTNHFPYELDDEDMSVDRYDSNSATLNNYFPTVRYTDEAIEDFFEQLKQAGLYEDSIIIIMGDHYGISATHDNAMADYLDKDEITPYDHIQLQRVPLFIHIPGIDEGEIKSEIGGQIDLKPTILHLLGINTEHDFYFGNDLFATDRKDFIALRNGDYISDDHIYTSGICYERESGDELESEEDETIVEGSIETPCDDVADQVAQELDYSDKIIYGDLFRFLDFKNDLP
ncbi:MAG TPA: LTA synthase family protein [Virgibacillus sp.]|nr:LTA synthase family protein [Virgibacillus sp.]